MKRTLKIFSLFFFCGLAQASIQGGAERLINQVDPQINLGVVVLDLSSGETLLSRFSSKSFIPASNMKLFSEAAALMALGPDYRFKNALSTDAKALKKGNLNGSIYLRLSGDPSFSRDQLKGLLAALKQWQIHSIQGDVVIDSALASVPPYAPGIMHEDIAYSYGAPVAPLILDSNRLTVTVNPGASPSDPAIVEVDDGGAGLAVINQAVTRAGPKCALDFKLNQEDQLTVRGCVSKGQWAVQQRLAIKNPLKYAQGMIIHQLNELNIHVHGQVLLGKTPAGTMLLRTQWSKPVSDLMADTLKPSDNLYADSLFLHAAAKLRGAPVAWAEAQPIIRNFLQSQTGVDLRTAILTDGSGLSRYDLVTPAQTIGLLRFLHERFPLSYEYIAALPVSGRDGTLQKRFRQPNQRGLIRAKTGTMTGVIGLSGYLYTANGHTLAFTMYFNRTPATKASVAARSRWLVDALCTYFLKQQPAGHSVARLSAPKGQVLFQTQPTQLERQRASAAKWRGLESRVKERLKNQNVAVLYRGNELVLQDRQADPKFVFNALQTLHAAYPFSLALSSKTAPSFSSNALKIFWIQTAVNPLGAVRLWSLRETL